MSSATEPTTPIEGQLALEKRDYIEGVMSHAKAQISSVRKLMGFALVLTAVLVALHWPVDPGLWCLLLPAGLLSIWLIPEHSRAVARRAFRVGHPGWRHAALTLDDTHVRSSGDKCEAYRPWSQFKGWLETDRLIILLARTGVSDVWPKDSFAPEDLDRLRERLDTKIRFAEPNRVPAVQSAKVTTGKRVLLVILLLLLVALYAVWRIGA